INYSKLNVEKTGNTNQKLSINTMPKIEDVKEGNLNAFGNKSEILNIKFSFRSTFNPDVAKLDIEGNMIYTGKDNKKSLESWGKNKSMPEEEHMEIINHLFKTAGIKALQLSEMVGIPPVLALPKVTKAKKK
ncbi:MAG: hypothetical protein KAJ56_03415, partial [Candidatus Aenigmarchaeota archaeon]|nr:hypothetical protein [Candidatus Aenigmarchaeota archaeon]